MDYSKAISPEVKLILERVRTQVDDYNKAFEILEKEVNQLENSHSSLKSFMSEADNLVKSSIIRLENLVKTSIKDLDRTTKQAVALNSELVEIQILRQDLEIIFKELKQQSADLNTTIVEFNFRSDKEVKKTLTLVQKKVEEEFEKESQKIEVRISIRLKQLESKLNQFEQRILQVNQEISTLTADLKQESKSLESKHAEIRNAQLGFRQELQNKIINTESVMHSRIDSNEDSIFDLAQRLDAIEANSNNSNDFGNQKQLHSNKDEELNKLAAEINTEVKKIKKEFSNFEDLKNDIEVNAKNQERKLNISLVLGIVSFIGLIILFILTTI